MDCIFEKCFFYLLSESNFVMFIYMNKSIFDDISPPIINKWAKKITKEYPTTISYSIVVFHKFHPQDKTRDHSDLCSSPNRIHFLLNSIILHWENLIEFRALSLLPKNYRDTTQCLITHFSVSQSNLAKEFSSSPCIRFLFMSILFTRKKATRRVNVTVTNMNTMRNNVVRSTDLMCMDSKISTKLSNTLHNVRGVCLSLEFHYLLHF